MNEDQKQRAFELLEAANEAGPNSGVLLQQEVVVVRSPGSPFHDAPTRFNENDLLAAVDLKLLHKSRVTGSFEWEWYTVVKTRTE